MGFRSDDQMRDLDLEPDSDKDFAARMMSKLHGRKVTTEELPMIFAEHAEERRARLRRQIDADDEPRSRCRSVDIEQDNIVAIPPNQKKSRVRLDDGLVLDFDANWRSHEEQLRMAFARITRRAGSRRH